VHAIEKIELFIKNNAQLLVWIDPEVAALKFQIKNLETELAQLAGKKVDLEKIISDFQYRHNKELGPIIMKILELRKRLYKDDPEKGPEAEQEEEEFKSQYEISSKKIKLEISEDQEKQLNKSWRTAAKLCHPDKFNNEPEEVQKRAEQLSKELKRRLPNHFNIVIASYTLQKVGCIYQFHIIRHIQLSKLIVTAT